MLALLILELNGALFVALHSAGKGTFSGCVVVVVEEVGVERQAE
jgi:hypothetical protein